MFGGSWTICCYIYSHCVSCAAPQKNECKTSFIHLCSVLAFKVVLSVLQVNSRREGVRLTSD